MKLTTKTILALSFALTIPSVTHGAVQSRSLAPSKITVPSGGNQIGLTITQNDTSKVALQVSSTIYSTGGGIKFADGTTQTTAASGSGGTSTAYTPTFTGLGTVSGTLANYHLSGDRMCIRGNTTSGTVTAVPLKWTIPSGYAIDYTKQTDGVSVLGFVISMPTTQDILINSGWSGLVTLQSSAAHEVYLGQYGSGTPGTIELRNANSYVVSGQRISFDFCVIVTVE